MIDRYIHETADYPVELCLINICLSNMKSCISCPDHCKVFLWQHSGAVPPPALSRWFKCPSNYEWMFVSMLVTLVILHEACLHRKWPICSIIMQNSSFKCMQTTQAHRVEAICSVAEFVEHFSLCVCFRNEAMSFWLIWTKQQDWSV